MSSTPAPCAAATAPTIPQTQSHSNHPQQAASSPSPSPESVNHARPGPAVRPAGFTAVNGGAPVGLATLDKDEDSRNSTNYQNIVIHQNEPSASIQMVHDHISRPLQSSSHIEPRQPLTHRLSPLPSNQHPHTAKDQPHPKPIQHRPDGPDSGAQPPTPKKQQHDGVANQHTNHETVTPKPRHLQSASKINPAPSTPAYTHAGQPENLQLSSQDQHQVSPPNQIDQRKLKQPHPNLQSNIQPHQHHVLQPQLQESDQHQPAQQESPPEQQKRQQAQQAQQKLQPQMQLQGQQQSPQQQLQLQHRQPSQSQQQQHQVRQSTHPQNQFEYQAQAAHTPQMSGLPGDQSSGPTVAERSPTYTPIEVSREQSRGPGLGSSNQKPSTPQSAPPSSGIGQYDSNRPRKRKRPGPGEANLPPNTPDFMLSTQDRAASPSGEMSGIRIASGLQQSQRRSQPLPPTDTPPPAPGAPTSSSSAAARKRSFSRRTKTGCQTCRKRKKKCDENKPECNNCVKGGYVCEGYPHGGKALWGTGSTIGGVVAKPAGPVFIPRTCGGPNEDPGGGGVGFGGAGGMANGEMIQAEESRAGGGSPPATPHLIVRSTRRDSISSGGPLTERVKMTSSQVYQPSAPELVADRNSCSLALARFHQASRVSSGVSEKELRRLFAAVLCGGESDHDSMMVNTLGGHGRGPSRHSFRESVQSPSLAGELSEGGGGGLGDNFAREGILLPDEGFKCHYGYNIRLGPQVRIGAQVLMIDPSPITIERGVVIGDRVTFSGEIGPHAGAQEAPGNPSTSTEPSAAEACMRPQPAGHSGEFGRSGGKAEIGAGGMGAGVPKGRGLPISVGANAWIGANAVIWGGVRIGREAWIGPGVVVRKDVPDEMRLEE